jgi:hypothetical protein
VKSCSWHPGWNTLPWRVRNILKSAHDVCENCDHHSDIRAVVMQFRVGQARWWIVNDRVVVPIWVVEFLKKHPERRSKPRDSSTPISRFDRGASQIPIAN